MEITYHMLLEEDTSKKLVDKYLTCGILFGAFYEKEVTGVCLLIFHNHISSEIINLAVLEKYQNQSVGKSLISMAENQARLLGCKYMEIGTAEPLVKYYEKAGYKYHKTIKNFFVDNYDFPVTDNGIILKDMVRLIKNL